MKQKTTRTTAQQSRRQAASPQSGPQRATQINNWGFRWHAGRFRVALWMTVVAFAIVLEIKRAGLVFPDSADSWDFRARLL